MKNDGRVFHTVTLEERRSGKSTALALKYLSEAISNPNELIEVKDHFDNPVAHECCGELIKEIIKKLQLEDITVSTLTDLSGKKSIRVSSGWLGVFTDDTGNIYKGIR